MEFVEDLFQNQPKKKADQGSNKRKHSNKQIKDIEIDDNSSEFVEDLFQNQPKKKADQGSNKRKHSNKQIKDIEIDDNTSETRKIIYLCKGNPKCKTKKGFTKCFKTFKTFKIHMYKTHDINIEEEKASNNIKGSENETQVSDITQSITNSILQAMKKIKVKSNDSDSDK
jgi:ribosomal protein L35